MEWERYEPRSAGGDRGGDDTIHGHVANITREVRGDELAAPTSAPWFVVELEDVGDFNDDQEGAVLIEGVVYTYDAGAVDVDLDRIQLNEPVGVGVALPIGTRVDAWNPAVPEGGDGQIVEWVADITDDLTGDAVQVPVAHHIVDYLGDGIRDLDGESVDATRDPDGEWWVTKVYGRPPVSKAPAQPRVVASRTADFVAAEGVWDPVDWTDIRVLVGIRTNGLHGFITEPGDYMVTAFVRFTDSSGVGRRGLRIKSNEIILGELLIPPNANDTALTVAGMFTADVVREVVAEVFQNSGSSQFIAQSCRLTIYKLA